MPLLWFNWIGLLRVCQMYSKALCLPEVSSVCSLQGIYLTFQNLFCLVTVVQSLQSTLCHPMDCSTSSFFVLHYLLEFAQTHVHWVSDAIQTSHSLSPPSLPALNLSKHQGLFQGVSSSHQVAKVLELQHQSLQWRTDFLQDWLVWSCSPRDSQESSPTPQFKSISSLVLSFLYSPTLTSIHNYWKNHRFD